MKFASDSVKRTLFFIGWSVMAIMIALVPFTYWWGVFEWHDGEFSLNRALFVWFFFGGAWLLTLFLWMERLRRPK